MKERICPHAVLTGLFLLAELVLYILILSTGGKVLIFSSFFSVVLCFLYALSDIKRGKRLLVCGLFFTVCADFCLVICDPIQQLWGMIFFLTAQSLYALHLFRLKPSRSRLLVRLTLIITALILCVIVLRNKTDALALVSLCYYGNLIMNIVDALANRKEEKLLPSAFLLFILCDTVIGLQVASTGYLSIGRESLLYKFLFMDFNLSWLFYLPSQVLIALSARKKV